MNMVRRERMITSRLCRSAVIAATTALLFAAPASAQQGPRRVAPGTNTCMRKMP
jgi:hypothetical protein